jgi:putative PEP-CTERM system histidine kinase
VESTTLHAAISFAGALTALGVAVAGLSRDPRSLRHRVFALGMTLQAAEVSVVGVSVLLSSAEEILRWQTVRWYIASLIPGTWMLFSLLVGRANLWPGLGKWWFAAAAAFLGPVGLFLLFPESRFPDQVVMVEGWGWGIPLGWPAYGVQILLLLASVGAVANLERTLRGAAGRIRWQLKFLVVGVGVLLAMRVFTSSQAILFRSVDISWGVFHGASLVVAGAILAIGLARAKLMDWEVFPSQTFLFNSVAVLFVGIYLLVVGFLASSMGRLGVGEEFSIRAFLVLVAMAGLAILLLSDRVRVKTRAFVWRHLKRPAFDYRQVWSDFTAQTHGIMEKPRLGKVVADFLSRGFEALSVSVWLLDETGETLILAGSSAVSSAQSEEEGTRGEALADLIRAMKGSAGPVDLEGSEGWAFEFQCAHAAFLSSHKVRYGVPLRVGEELLGMVTLGERVQWTPLSEEELELLQTLAHQTAASFLNLSLGERIRADQEMAAFQTVSAFFVHDLKTLASGLSLLIQNLPLHYDDPDFRKDALALIAGNVEKIKKLLERVSALREGLQVTASEVDLDRFVDETIREMDGTVRCPVMTDAKSGLQVRLDPGHMRAVLRNLVLNADEASVNGNPIRVSTCGQGDWAVISVEDQGEGMSREFIQEGLFRPFRTTKKKGLGIGLYQSKTVVEAQGGRIAVESEEGKGTTFRVMLPRGEGVGCRT